MGGVERRHNGCAVEWGTPQNGFFGLERKGSVSFTTASWELTLAYLRDISVELEAETGTSMQLLSSLRAPLGGSVGREYHRWGSRAGVENVDHRNCEPTRKIFHVRGHILRANWNTAFAHLLHFKYNTSAHRAEVGNCRIACHSVGRERCGCYLAFAGLAASIRWEQGLSFPRNWG